MVDRTDCDTCQAVYAPSRWDTDADRARKKDGPPCGTCRPDVLPTNALAVDVYRRCSGQMVMSMAGPVDINLLAVKCVMEWMRVPPAEQWHLFEQVQLLAQSVIQAGREKQDREQGRGKAQG